MPDESNPQAQGTEQTTPPAVEPSAREAIQQKYDKMYGQDAAASNPNPPPVAAVSAPAVAPSVDYSETIRTLTAQIAALEARTAPPPAAAAAAPVVEEDWLALLASGKKDEGEKAMAARVLSLIGNNLQSNSVQQAVALVNAERDINSFVAEVRQQNPDILPMEQFITLAAQARIERARAAGKITSPSDYVSVYKESVTAEIKSARELLLTIRGEGKREGQVRTSEVMSSSTIPPNVVTQRQDQQSTQKPESQGESYDDYMLARAAKQAGLRGMGA